MTLDARAATLGRMDRKKTYIAALAAGAAVAGSLIAVGVLGSGGGTPQPTQTAASTPTIVGVPEARGLFAGIPQKGAVLGAANAPVTLVEYADPQCPYCAQWALGALPTIVQEYVRSGKVRIELRPLAFIGADSRAGCQRARRGRHARPAVRGRCTSCTRTRASRTPVGSTTRFSARWRSSWA